MTFAELVLFIWRQDNCAVDVDYAYIQQTHVYVLSAISRTNFRKRNAISAAQSIQREKLSSDQKGKAVRRFFLNDPESQTTKKMLQQIHAAIMANETLPAGSLKRKTILSPNARRNESNT